MREVIERFGTTYSRKPGIQVRRAVAVDDGISALFEIEFWQQITAYASVEAELVEAQLTPTALRA